MLIAMESIGNNFFHLTIWCIGGLVENITSASEINCDWDIRLLYDGDCDLCMREVSMLRGRDSGAGKIDFVDIAAPDYVPEENSGVTYAEVSHCLTSYHEVIQP